MEKSNKYKAPKLEEMTLDYLRGYQRAITDLELMAELQKEEAHEYEYELLLIVVAGLYEFLNLKKNFKKTWDEITSKQA